MAILFDQNAKTFHLTNGRVSYIFRLAGGKYPMHVHWGRSVRAVSDELIARRTIWTEETFSLNETVMDFLPMECPTFAGDLREGMVHVIHESGMSALLLEYESHQIISGKPELPGLPSARGENAQSLLLMLRDVVSGVGVELCYTIYEDVDVIARSARIINGSKTPVTVDKALSACVDFEGCDMNLTTLSGAWVRERQLYTRPLVPGDQGTSSTRGASSVQTSPFMMLTSRDATETTGEAFGFALCYSGGFEASVHVDQHFISRAQIGIQPFNFAWRLEPGETFQTPEAYLCYSCEGTGGMSRNFHALVHNHITTGKFARSTRPILCNNWEATYFDFNEEKLLDLARAAVRADIDLFVLDDGWFGHRNGDNSSLGDWFDDTRKLPDGLSSLSEKIHALGLKFGLWVEPEMISVDSELYRAHPDWCIHVPGYPRIEYRNQLVLDLSRDEVRDYIVDVIIAALKRGNVDYVKWDMNRFINMWGSAALPANRQQELGHRYILGVYDMMRRITSAFPDVLFESCAGGGGRFDLGMMCFMPQAWCTDDTDAWMRCRIQHSTSLVFPPSTMGAHVSAVPNHQTGRVAPLATRAAVAMSGTYGYELDLTKLPEEEIEQIRKLNKRLREIQPLMFYGDYYRLLSPYEGNEAAWMSVSKDKREAVITHVYAQAIPNMKDRLLRMTGLDPKLTYRDTETGKTYGGDELMYYGIFLKRPWGDYMSQQWHLVAID